MQQVHARKLIVTALYDYISTDENNLSFSAGDVIRVLNQLESGWWNGICKNKRGWFPSNYVAVASTTIATADLKIPEGHSRSISSIPTAHPISVTYQPQTPKSAQSESSTFSFSKAMASLNTEQKLPLNWTQKVSNDGRVYFHNSVNESTTWSIENINHESGQAIVLDEVAQSKRSSSNPSSPSQILSWNSLSDDIVAAIHNLNTSAKNDQKDHFIPQSSIIVESIRIMLYASGTARKDAPIVASHKSIRLHHRHIMNSLSKLVLGAKLASGAYPPADSILKLQTCCHDVLQAVRHFVTAAIDVGITVQLIYLAPETHTSHGDLANHSPAHQLRSLDDYTRKIIKQIGNLMRSIRSDQCNSSTLIADVRLMVTEVGDFLSSVDEIPALDPSNMLMEDELAVDFKVSRLALYNSISGLVMATQTATSPLAPSNALEQVVLSTGLVEKAVRDLLVSTKFLIEEKEIMQLAVADGDPSLVKPRRTVSLSALAPPALLPILESELTLVHNQQPQHIHQHMSINNSLPRTLKDNTSPLNQKDYPKSAGPGPGPVRPYDEANDSDQRRSNGRDKIKKFFGEVPSAAAPASPKKDAPRPWFLEYEYDPSDILFNMEGKVKGGTLPALVERVTLHDSFNSNFTLNFLLTYRSFTTSTEFFGLLKERFLIKPDASLTDNELKIWKEKKETPVRLRVFNIMKSWIETYCEDYPEDRKVLQEMKQFAATTMSDISFASQQLIKLAEKRERNVGSLRIMVQTSRECPPPILPRNLKKLKFLDIDPLEIARQLTMLESKDFNKVEPVEFLKKAWSDKESDISVNVKNVVNMSNLVTSWVAESILLCKDIKIRAAYIKHFVLVAERCRNLNNFNTLMSILAGLNSAPIHRLKRTFELLSTKSQATLEIIRNLMSTTKNFSTYRESLRNCTGAAIPFLGCYLTDLTFIEDGNPDFLKVDARLINFSKRAKTAEVIREIQQYQSLPYNITPVPELQTFLAQCLEDSLGEGQMYDLSLQLEPREREDEKIARLLTESGFL